MLTTLPDRAQGQSVKDRVILPLEHLHALHCEQEERMQWRPAQDRRAGFGKVALVFARVSRRPCAARELAWQCLFHAARPRPTRAWAPSDGITMAKAACMSKRAPIMTPAGFGEYDAPVRSWLTCSTIAAYQGMEENV